MTSKIVKCGLQPKDTEYVGPMTKESAQASWYNKVFLVGNTLPNGTIRAYVPKKQFEKAEERDDKFYRNYIPKPLGKAFSICSM